jgi:hypothetical protein
VFFLVLTREVLLADIEVSQDYGASIIIFEVHENL